MCPRPARSWCEGSSIHVSPHPSSQPDTEERQELGLQISKLIVFFWIQDFRFMWHIES